MLHADEIARAERTSYSIISLKRISLPDDYHGGDPSNGGSTRGLDPIKMAERSAGDSGDHFCLICCLTNSHWVPAASLEPFIQLHIIFTTVRVACTVPCAPHLPCTCLKGPK
jgi:hypothetical protein